MSQPRTIDNPIDENDGQSLPTAAVSEDQIMLQFGKALREVTRIRDTYTTTACSVCEQLFALIWNQFAVLKIERVSLQK